MERRMISKEDELSPGGGETEVRREDQDRINRFSRLNNRESQIEEQLKAKQKAKEDLEEISNELELADEEDKIPYKIGDSFVSIKVEKAITRLTSEIDQVDEDVSELESKLDTIREEMESLKIDLYARFGKTINLER